VRLAAAEYRGREGCYPRPGIGPPAARAVSLGPREMACREVVTVQEGPRQARHVGGSPGGAIEASGAVDEDLAT